MTDTQVTVRKGMDFLRKVFLYLSAGLICLLLLGLIGTILYRGLSHLSLGLVLSKPSLLKGTDGILPNILNTIYLIVLTLAVVLPIGVGAAVYLNEYAKNKKLVSLIELAAETLAGIPSILYGLVGMLLFVEFFSFGTSLLAGAFTLVIVTLPTIIRTTQESLKTVPNSYREGSFALGAGKWHMIRTVVLPCVIDGVVTGCILSVGRVVGESAALLYTAGMAHEMLNIREAVTPGNAGSSLTVALYMYAKERGRFDIAFAIAVILLLLVFAINFLAKSVADREKKKRS